MNQKTISLLICALGGEGAGVLTEWIIEAAKERGLKAQSTSIPGVAQRTGATTYYIEVFRERLASENSPTPLFSLTPMPARLDCLLSSELLETARQCTLGLPSAKRTLTLSSSARSVTTQERMELGDGRLDETQLRKIVIQSSKEHYFLDMQSLAKREGTIVSSVMLGVIAASELFPIPKETFQKVVSMSPLNGQASLRGFNAGFEALFELKSQAQMITKLLEEDHQEGINTSKIETPIRENFPLSTHPMISLGYQRVLDYGGQPYATLYLERLGEMLKNEKLADPNLTRDFVITSTVARWLALWMSFEDIIRVADLKSRPARWDRIKKENKALPSDLNKVYDHFKPGIPELAALLPRGLANKLLSWERQRVASGSEELALPLKIGTHTVIGFFVLRALASLKSLRRFGFRYQEEQSLIEAWLSSIMTSTQIDYQLGLEVAHCGQLIKGYGKTNARGKSNLIHILKTVVSSNQSIEKRVQSIAEIKAAALKDESGRSLDETLLKHGAPAREVPIQPIRWIKKPKF